MAQYNKNCVIDGTPFTSARKDKLTCSPACQKKLQRGGITAASQTLGPEQTDTFLEEGADTPQATLQPESQNTNMESNSSIVGAEQKAPMTIPANLLKDRQDRVERLNARLRAKGLPMVVPDGWHDSFLPTGIPEIDALTKNQDAAGIGGFPRGKITEIFGYKGSGKSSLVKLIMQAHPETRVLFFDAEGGLNSPPENVTVIKGNVVEEIMSAMVEAVQTQDYDLVILDSVASLVTQKEFDGDPEGMAAMARSFGPQVKRLLAHLQPLKDGLPDPAATAAVFINQYRDTTKSFGKTKYTVGGKALEYYSSLRLEFASFISKDKIIRNKQIAGQRINVKVEKTRYGRPGQEFTFELLWDVLEDYDAWAQKRIQELLEEV